MSIIESTLCFLFRYGRPRRPNETGQPAASYLNGYVDDLRITKGVARYTAAFTPMPAAFQDY